MRHLILSTLLAMASLLVLTPDAEAHSRHNRGVAVQESTIATPSVGYKAPEPHTLGGAFELVDHTGRSVTQASWPGKTSVLYFGFAGCCESCPIALDSLSRALELMGADAEKIQPLFVDIDMEGPDLKALSQFVSNFDPRIVGLTGSHKQIFHMLRLYKVRREYGHGGMGKKETGPRIDHTTYLFVVGADGVCKSYFYHNLTPEKMAEAIRKSM